MLEYLRRELGENVSLVAMKDIQGALDRAVRTAVLILGGVASMTLVVASICIMNATYTAVTERVKIIGVMRAMGATRTGIAAAFLTEGAIVALAAGVLRVLLGYPSGSLLIAFIVGGGPRGPPESEFTIQAELPLPYALGILTATLAVTLIGSIPPALRAASLEPSEALRYE